jgi:hypothetical protein
MVVMWDKMGKLFHPTWIKNNGEVGSQQFRDWTESLQWFGAKGVLNGMAATESSGSDYPPKLNKFIGYCIKSGSQNDSKAYGPWEKCPYTGRMRRLKPGYESLAARLGDGIADKRTPDEIRDDIESMLAMPDPYADMRTG